MRSFKRYIFSEARIIVLVILITIVMPSVLLSVFSIWAISAERAHVQDRIRRDAQILSDKVIEATFSKFASVRSEISGQLAELDSPDACKSFLKKLQSSNPGFTSLIVLDKEGSVLFPLTPDAAAMILLEPKSAELHEALREAQNLEFVQLDYEAAKKTYSSIMETATDSRLKTAALSGLARLSWKNNEWKDAIDKYKNIIENHGSTRDENGLLAGPTAALRIAEILLVKGTPEEFVGQLDFAYEQLATNRAELTYEEAEFFDAKIYSLADDFLAGGVTAGQQVQKAQQVRNKLDRMRSDEAMAGEIALKLMGAQYGEESGIVDFEYRGNEFIVAGTRGDAGTDLIGAFGVMPLEELKKRVIVPEMRKLVTSEEMGIVVTHGASGIVAGERPPARSFKLGEVGFPEPFKDFRVQTYLKGYKSLASLSSMRTNIYVWAVGLAITGILAGVITTYMSVRRTIRSAELKSDFVSNVTHELKTPLTSIRMFAETLHEGRVKNEQDAKECLETIMIESERLTRLIDKVLDFRAIEKGKRKFEFKLSDPKKVILDSLQTFRRQMHGCEATIYVNIPNDIQHVRMDTDAIGEVLLNLLTNAYKYSRPEDRRIWVEAQTVDGTLRISVKDSGIGIPEKEYKAIFEKFYRVDDRLTAEVDGTGLGLTISQHVAQAHGGNIKVDSTEGKGSKFTLTVKI